MEGVFPLELVRVKGGVKMRRPNLSRAAEGGEVEGCTSAAVEEFVRFGSTGWEWARSRVLLALTRAVAAFWSACFFRDQARLASQCLNLGSMMQIALTRSFGNCNAAAGRNAVASSNGYANEDDAWNKHVDCRFLCLVAYRSRTRFMAACCRARG